MQAAGQPWVAPPADETPFSTCDIAGSLHMELYSDVVELMAARLLLSLWGEVDPAVRRDPSAGGGGAAFAWDKDRAVDAGGASSGPKRVVLMARVTSNDSKVTQQ